jgi:PAS domain S-box-containing protein
MKRQVAFDWESAIQRRRDIILNHLLLTGGLGGGIAVVLLFLPRNTILQEQVKSTLPFVAGWLLVSVAWLLRNSLGYYVRALALLLITYLLGFFLLLNGGLSGSGRIWLVLFPMAAVIMLDVWPGGVLAGVLSVLTYAFFAFVFGQGMLWLKPPNAATGMERWVTEGGDFLIAVAGPVLGMWGFRQGWLEALRKTSAINQELEGAMQDLQILNAQLDARVVERTRQLAGALARNEAILAGIADGVVVFDEGGRVVTANPAMGSLLERPADAMVGQTIETLMGRDVVETDQEMIGKLLRNEGITWSGFKFRWGDKTFAVSIAPVHGDAGFATRTVAVFHDFTQEAEIDRMRRSFLEIASHDLRSPLSAVLGLAELLQAGSYGMLAPEQEEPVERIASNARYMASLVSNLLGQAQIEAGVLALNVSSFSPAEVVNRVICGLEALAQSKELALREEVAESVPNIIWNDEQKVSQILMNLVGNAIQFTLTGSVKVRAYTPNEDCWALEVADTGPGISKRMQEHVFDRYQRADEVASADYVGVGLGLSIVKQLVEIMGGEIRLKSEMGKGSTFTVVLPLLERDGTPRS